MTKSNCFDFGALVVPKYLQPRIEAAYKCIAEEHPGALSSQFVLNTLISCGLEAIEPQHLVPDGGGVAKALQVMVSPSSTRRDQKKARAFVQWAVCMEKEQSTVSSWLADAIEMFDPDELQFLNIEEHNPAAVAEFRAKLRGVEPEVIERVYDDSVQEPLTASEQGRD